MNEEQLLFAVLAFDSDLIDLPQLKEVCQAWTQDRSQSLADLIFERGWISLEDRDFVARRMERKLAKYQNDARATLNSVARGDAVDTLLEIPDQEIRESLSLWPAAAPALMEVIDQGQPEGDFPKSRYTWISEVGKGGLGKVWLATDNSLGREVALKELKAGASSTETVRSLIKEAQITGQLQHPGIVPIYEVNREGRPFYTMKLVRGETLSAAIAGHHQQVASGEIDPLSLPRLLSVFSSVCDAVGYAHSRGIIHRDLKPLNIVLGEYGEAIVLDWGLAKSISSKDDSSQGVVVSQDAETDETQQGATPGTPAYMAPEQARGQVELMDQKTDIYGLGAILFEILTGQPPHSIRSFPGVHEPTTGESAGKSNAALETPAEPDNLPPVAERPLFETPISRLMQQIAIGQTPRVRDFDSSIPAELDAICAKAMAFERDDRFSSARELKTALLEYQVHEESIDLASRAREDLAEARESQDYGDFSRVLFGFEAALEQWPDNATATAGLRDARYEYAVCARDKRDFDLALSLLDAKIDAHQTLMSELHDSREEMLTRERDLAESRRARQRLKRLLAGTTIATLIIVSVLAIFAEYQRRDAVTQRLAADRERDKADEERRKAVEAADAEREAKTLAITERDRAARRLYLNQIIQATSDFESKRFEQAQESIHKVPLDDRRWDAQYLNRVIAGTPLTLRKHSGYISSVDFSPDGTRLVSASHDRTARVWDLSTGQQLLRLATPTSADCVSFSPGGTRIAAGTFGSIAIPGVKITPGINENSPGKILVWDAASGEELLSLTGHTGAVTSLHFSPDGSRLLTSGNTLRDTGALEDNPGELKLLNSSTGDVVFTMSGHTDSVTCASFSPDGSRIVSGDASGEVRLWDATSGQELSAFAGDDHRIMDVFFSPDDTHLIGNGIGGLKKWNFEGKEIGRLQEDGFNCIAALPDGSRFICGSQEGQSRIFSNHEPVPDRSLKAIDAKTGETLATIPSHFDRISTLSVSPDGTRVVSGSADHTIKIYDVILFPDTVSGTAFWHATGTHKFVTLNVKESHDGKQIASSSADKTIKIWDSFSGLETRTLEGHTEAVWGLSFSPDGKHLASGSDDKTIRIWDRSGTTEPVILKGHTGEVRSVHYSHDGKWLVSGSVDKSIKIWNTETHQEHLTIQGHNEPVICVAFSPNGRKIVSCGGDTASITLGSAAGELKLWDAVSGDELLAFDGHEESVYSAAFSVDGTKIVSASLDETSRIWDAETGEQIIVLRGHTEAVRSAAFSPDGTRVVTGSNDGTTRLWHATGGEEIKKFPIESPVVCFSPDGMRILNCGGYSKSFSVLDASCGKEIHLLGRQSDPVSDVCFSPQGTHVASSSSYNSRNTKQLWDCELKLWSIDGKEQKTLLHRYPHRILWTYFNHDGSQVSIIDDRLKEVSWELPSGERLSEEPDTQRMPDSAFASTVSPIDEHLSVAGAHDQVLLIRSNPNVAQRHWRGLSGRRAFLKKHWHLGKISKKHDPKRLFSDVFHMRQVRPLLTKEQQVEWDKLIENMETLLKQRQARSQRRPESSTKP